MQTLPGRVLCRVFAMGVDSILFQIRNGSGLQGNWFFFFNLTSIVQLYKQCPERKIKCLKSKNYAILFCGGGGLMYPTLALKHQQLRPASNFRSSAFTSQMLGL